MKLSAFYSFAASLAGLSTCKRLQVGCLIVPMDLTEVMAIGYNGPPTGISNDACRKQAGSCGCIHAEANSLVKLRTNETGLVALLTHSPCEHCAGLLLNSRRISNVAYAVEYRDLAGVKLLLDGGISVSRVNPAYGLAVQGPEMGEPGASGPIVD